MDKPIVHFTGAPQFFITDDQKAARLYALDHPKLGKGYVWSSLVINHNEDGSFETLNTIYKPYKDSNDSID